MSPLDAPKRSTVQILHWPLAIAIGLLGLWQFHIPQFASNFDKFPGDRGDARLVAYIMEHWYRVFQNLASWRSPAMFYPVEGTIGYADLMLGYGIVYSGLRTLGLGMFEAAEFTIILFNFLNYLVCFILLRKVLRFHLLASIAGAAFFAFNNAKLVQLGHLQLQPILFLPLAVIGVVLLVQKRETLNQKQAFGLIALTAVSIALQLLTGFYPGWFFIFWSGLFFVLTLLVKRTRNVVLEVGRKFWGALLAGIAVFVVALIPFALAYLPIIRAVGGRPYEEIQRLIPLPWSFLVMGRRNYLWGGISEAIQSRYPMSPELQIGIGLVPTLAWAGLVVLAIWFLIKKVFLAKAQRRKEEVGLCAFASLRETTSSLPRAVNLRDVPRLPDRNAILERFQSVAVCLFFRPGWAGDQGCRALRVGPGAANGDRFRLRDSFPDRSDLASDQSAASNTSVHLPLCFDCFRISRTVWT